MSDKPLSPQKLRDAARYLRQFNDWRCGKLPDDAFDADPKKITAALNIVTAAVLGKKFQSR